MNQTDELREENTVLRACLARLSEAGLRVSESLDARTVLHEVVESARVLTGARYGVLTAMQDSGRIPEVVASGFSAEEHQRLLDFPGRWDLYGDLRELPEPLSLLTLADYDSSLGISGYLPGDLRKDATLLAVPMRHRGAHVGTFFLAGKQPGHEFTNGDQEVLVMFAAQAATAIANARRYREEQRAKADLEALVNTAPVGLVVFDARTGSMLSLNREAKRIVGHLRSPGRSLEQLLEAVSIRRADGREISLEELPLAQALVNATPARAEEIVLQVADGRSVTTLVKATPVPSGGGEAESVVVTLQDMSPLEELERMRAEYLGMVSHELRAPLASVKGCAATVLGSAPGPDPAEMLQFFRIIEEQADRMRKLIGDLLDAGRIEAGTLSVDPEPAEVAGLVDRARNTLLSAGGSNPLQIDLPPDLPRVLADRRRIVQVLGNLLSNASKHSPQPSPIRVTAVREGSHVAISVADEGIGMSAEMLPQLFGKCVRTGGDGQGRPFAGSGLGLVICKGLVEAHGGRIRAESGGAGQGTRFTFTIPVAAEAASRAAPGRARSSAPAVQEGTRVLVVDDDPQTQRYVRHALRQAGFSTTITEDPREVPGLIQENRPDLVLLDLMLSGKDGIELMERVPEMRDLPVIFLSAYDRGDTVARALEKGAADYVVKPFSPTELVARIQAALRARAEPAAPFVLGELAINYEERQVTLAGRPVELTATEYGLLRELSVNAGRVCTHAALLGRFWGRRNSRDIRLVHAFMKKLRHKLGDDATSPTYIFTVHGVGYRMAKPDRS